MLNEGCDEEPEMSERRKRIEGMLNPPADDEAPNGLESEDGELEEQAAGKYMQQDRSPNGVPYGNHGQKESFQKGDKVTTSGVGRTAKWKKGTGTVTNVKGKSVFVHWDGTSFEDEMTEEEVNWIKKKNPEESNIEYFQRNSIELSKKKGDEVYSIPSKKSNKP